MSGIGLVLGKSAKTMARTLGLRPPHALKKAQVSDFFANGFLVLPGFFSAAEVDQVNDAVERAWADQSIYNNLTISAYTGTSRYIETYHRNVERDARKLRHKLNHLYLYDHGVLGLLLSNKLQGVLDQLLDGPPLLFNGLNMEKGTEQRFHFDSFYMASRTQDKLVATWLALEDIHPDSGPLNYYPRSHLIPPYRFSHGGIWAVDEEMGAFDIYIDREIKTRGLKTEAFYPKKGDLFIWHGQLYHAGGKINNHALTRKSMVNHFWRVTDYPREQCLEARPGRFILKPNYMFVSPIFKPIV